MKANVLGEKWSVIYFHFERNNHSADSRLMFSHNSFLLGTTFLECCWNEQIIEIQDGKWTRSVQNIFEFFFHIFHDQFYDDVRKCVDEIENLIFVIIYLFCRSQQSSSGSTQFYLHTSLLLIRFYLYFHLKSKRQTEFAQRRSSLGNSKNCLFKQVIEFHRCPFFVFFLQNFSTVILSKIWFE